MILEWKHCLDIIQLGRFSKMKITMLIYRKSKKCTTGLLWFLWDIWLGKLMHLFEKMNQSLHSKGSDFRIRIGLNVEKNVKALQKRIVFKNLFSLQLENLRMNNKFLFYLIMIEKKQLRLKLKFRGFVKKNTHIGCFNGKEIMVRTCTEGNKRLFFLWENPFSLMCKSKGVSMRKSCEQVVKNRVTENTTWCSFWKAVWRLKIFSKKFENELNHKNIHC